MTFERLKFFICLSLEYKRIRKDLRKCLKIFIFEYKAQQEIFFIE
jgi:hypothetical protein